MIKVRIFLLGLLIVVTIIIFYLFQTKSGYDRLKNILESYISYRVDKSVEILYLDIKDYPNIRIKLKINQVANLYLYGIINRDVVNMKYHIWGDYLEVNGLSIKENYNFFGTAKGKISHLKIKGNGKFFNGDMEYSFRKTTNSIKDILFSMSSVDSRKILSFLGKESIFKTLIDINGTFSSLDDYNKIGKIKIHSYNGTIPTIDNNITISSDMRVDFNKSTYTYKGDIYSNIASIHIENGTYSELNKSINLEYNLLLDRVNFLNKISETKVKDDLNIDGKLIYQIDNQNIQIDGYNNMFEGDIILHYKGNNVNMELEDVSLVKIFDFFSYQAPFKSRLYGNINLDTKDRVVLMNLKLNRLHFLKSEFTKNIEKSLYVDILKMDFNKSIFYGGYKDSLLHATLKIDDGIKNHIFLTDVILNISNRNINSNIEMILKKEEIFGKIYGGLDNPKFKVDKSKYMKYRILKSFGG